MSLLPKPRATHGQVQLDVPSFPKRNVDKKTTSTLVPHSVSKNRKQKLDEKPTLQVGSHECIEYFCINLHLVIILQSIILLIEFFSTPNIDSYNRMTLLMMMKKKVGPFLSSHA